MTEPNELASTKHDELHGQVTISLQEGRSRTLKNGDTFAIFDHNGDAVPRAEGSEGLYHRDTRYLSCFNLKIVGAQPKLLSSTLSDDNTTLTCDLTNPDLFDHNNVLVLPQGLLHIRRSRLLWRASLLERLAITNFDDTQQQVRVEIEFAADFADLFEIRGAQRERRGHEHPPLVQDESVTLAYTGLDRLFRETKLRFVPAPFKLTSRHAVFELTMAAKETRSFFIEIDCRPDHVEKNDSVSEGFFSSLREARRTYRATVSRTVGIISSNELFNKAINRSVSDLFMLTTQLPSGPYPYAGIPWFSTAFGRDALFTAWQTLWFDPAIAKGVLRFLADNQAIKEDAISDSEPGKILHEARDGEMAKLGEVPFRRYYGSIDSTPLFLCVAGAYLERTGDLTLIRNLLPNLKAALTWIDLYGDRDGDGFVEYGRRSTEGLVNQGWKDSHDSIFHADATLARGPIALVEVQAYVYGARQALADIFERIGEQAQAANQRAKADKLQKQFDARFFDEKLGTYVLALDGEKKPCRVRSSNAGHALFTGIAYPERAASVVTNLMSGSSFSGWGIRTIATTEARYNPMSYHNGSVWPHDNAVIAAGFARYGFRREAARIFEALFSASAYLDLQRLPELFCGFSRRYGRGPTLYPVACSPQAWAAATFISLIQSTLGLEFKTTNEEITFSQPVLPRFLDRIKLHGLVVGERIVNADLIRAVSEVNVNFATR